MKFALTHQPQIWITVMTLAAVAAASLLLALPVSGHAEASRPADAAIVNRVLNVTGTTGGDHITLRLKSGDANVLEVDADGDATADFSFDRSLFDQISVNARNGDDVVGVAEANGKIDEPTAIRGGNGNDTILGGSAVDTIYGGNGDDFVDGNGGNDIAFMGNGDDTFRWDPGDGSDTVEGQHGYDTLGFNGADAGETVDLSAQGRRFIFFRNPGNVTMDMDGIEASVFNAFGGADTITVNDLSETDVTRVAFNLDSGLRTGVGDGQPDRVIVNGTAGNDRIAVSGQDGAVEVTGLAARVAIRSAEFANDRLEIHTLAGNDQVDSEGLAAGVIQLFVSP